jgi:hypothetical protein
MSDAQKPHAWAVKAHSLMWTGEFAEVDAKAEAARTGCMSHAYPLFTKPTPPDVQQPPFGTKRKAAMALYVPPFKHLHGYIYDSSGQMVADDEGVEASIAARVRGWGRIGYLPNGGSVQDEVGDMMADAMNAYYAPPTLTPPDGWAEAVKSAQFFQDSFGLTLQNHAPELAQAILDMDAKIRGVTP